jgi:uncharacterized membrane protein
VTEQAFREEPEERVVHRLEAFSDIVIGFSLAELTLSLTLPRDALTLFTTQWLPLAAFGMTFAIVSGMWWAHHRLFTHYFVPTAPNIVLNFLSLGGVMFLVYSLQVWLHSEVHKNVAYAMYGCSVAWIMGILAFLMYRGVALRGHRMDPRLASRGRRASLRFALMSAIFLLLGVSSALLKSTDSIEIVVIVLAALVAVSRFLLREGPTPAQQ